MPEVVVENGYRLEHNEDGPYNEGVGYNEQEAGVEGEGTQGDMDLDGNLTQEHFDYAKVGRIRDDFDVREFEWEEEEWEVEDRMGDDVSSDSDDSGDDNGGTDARATLVVPMPTPVPTEVLHAMPTQGRLVHDLPEEDTPYDSWGRISEAQQYVLPPPYTAAELIQMREANLPFSVVPNYRDVSMVQETQPQRAPLMAYVVRISCNPLFYLTRSVLFYFKNTNCCNLLVCLGLTTDKDVQ
jgi:hypothetical protein